MPADRPLAEIGRTARLLRRPPEGGAAREGRAARSDLRDLRLGGEDDLVRLLARVDALKSFLDSDDGANLLVAYRRASNIVQASRRRRTKSRTTAAPMRRSCSRPRRRRSMPRWPPWRPPAPSMIKSEDFGSAMSAAGQAARAGRCLLRQGDRQQRRQGSARQSAAAAVGDPHDAEQRRRFLADRGMTC